MRHLLIPAAPLPEASSAAAAARALALPHLDAIAPRLRVERVFEPPEDGPTTPHELALAAALGLPLDGSALPWAALESGTAGTPCAWLRPVNLQLGMDRIELTEPTLLALGDAESRALLAACAPLLADDGIACAHVAPGKWLARGEAFRGLVTTSPEAAVGRHLSRGELMHAPDDATQRHLARLASELEMLLAAHPVNDAREAARNWTVNAVWIHGAGALAAPLAPRPGVVAAPQLAVPGVAQSPEQAAAAWRAIDAELAAPLAAAMRAGQPVRLTLAGPRRAVTYTSEGIGALARFKMLFGRQRLSHLREQL